MFPYKVDVSKGESEIVQLHAFSLGYKWEYDSTKANDKHNPLYLRSHYLYFNKDGFIWASDDLKYFRNEREHKLVSIDEFLLLK